MECRAFLCMATLFTIWAMLPAELNHKLNWSIVYYNLLGVNCMIYTKCLGGQKASNLVLFDSKIDTVLLSKVH